MHTESVERSSPGEMIKVTQNDQNVITIIAATTSVAVVVISVVLFLLLLFRKLKKSQTG